MPDPGSLFEAAIKPFKKDVRFYEILRWVDALGPIELSRPQGSARDRSLPCTHLAETKKPTAVTHWKSRTTPKCLVAIESTIRAWQWRLELNKPPRKACKLTTENLYCPELESVPDVKALGDDLRASLGDTFAEIERAVEAHIVAVWDPYLEALAAPPPPATATRVPGWRLERLRECLEVPHVKDAVAKAFDSKPSALEGALLAPRPLADRARCLERALKSVSDPAAADAIRTLTGLLLVDPAQTGGHGHVRRDGIKLPISAAVARSSAEGSRVVPERRGKRVRAETDVTPLEMGIDPAGAFSLDVAATAVQRVADNDGDAHALVEERVESADFARELGDEPPPGFFMFVRSPEENAAASKRLKEACASELGPIGLVESYGPPEDASAETKLEIRLARILKK